jgi:hypothetical protein
LLLLLLLLLLVLLLLLLLLLLIVRASCWLMGSQEGRHGADWKDLEGLSFLFVKTPCWEHESLLRVVRGLGGIFECLYF